MLCSIARRLWQSGACITYTRGQSRTCYRHIHALVQLRGLSLRGEGPSHKLHLLKTNDAATGCEKVCVGRGKKMSEQVFITLVNCIVRGLSRDGKQVTGNVPKHWTNS
ncbi:hypothetical protein GQ600_5552 [Phytophthora cactorum]|nr:hypothetical protein GQ600_5552 [Phytophthora cactorum]